MQKSKKCFYVFWVLMFLLISKSTYAQTAISIGRTGLYSGVVQMGGGQRYSTTRFIYSSTEIGTSGIISDISFFVATPGLISADVNIYMRHRSTNTFASADEDYRIYDFEHVFSGTVNMGNVKGCETYKLSKQFEYNGIDALEVVITKNASATSELSYYVDGPSNTCLYRYNKYSSGYSDFSKYDYAYAKADMRPCSKLTISKRIINVNNIIYSLNDDYSATVISCNSSLENIVIPSSIMDKDGIVYSVKSVTSAFVGNNVVKDITLPSTLTSIGDASFKGCSKLKSITIPNSVTTIGVAAFNECESLEYVTLPNKLITISDNSFANCSKLLSVTIPNSVVSIGNRAFTGCPLYSVTIGSKVESIGTEAFGEFIKAIWLGNTPPKGYATVNAYINYVSNDLYTKLSNVTKNNYLSSMFTIGGIKYVLLNQYTCDAIDCCYDPTAKDINLEANVIYRTKSFKVVSVEKYACYKNPYIKNVTIAHTGPIMDQAFYECDSIEKAIIKNGNFVSNHAFRSCKALKSVEISNDGNIYNSVFSDCKSLETAVINNNGNIGTYAFYGCTALNNIIVTNKGNIEDRAFYQCKLDNAEISNNGDIAPYAFLECSGLTIAHINNTGKIKEYAFSSCVAMKELIIGNKVKTIGNYCFQNCKKMTKATIGELVSSIGEYAFDGAISLNSISIPNSVDSIGAYCFNNCSSLKKAIIGTGIKAIPIYTFNDCKSLSEIEIPSSVEVISNYSFLGCTNLQKVIIEDKESIIQLGSNGNLPLFSDCKLDSVYIGRKLKFYKSKDEGYSPFCGNEYLRTITFNNREDSIYNYQFNGCSSLEKIKLGAETKYLGDYAFSSCSKLEGIYIPNMTTYLGKYCFSGCASLKYANIGIRIPDILEYTFNNCKSLPTIVIPSNIKSIADFALAGCSSLKNVIISDRKQILTLGSNKDKPLFCDCPLDSVYIGAKISYKTSSNYGYSPFHHNTTLRTVVITDEETKIYDNEFYQCYGLESVIIGDGVKTIGNWAFSGCTSLLFFSFGNNVSSIGQEAFSDCSEMVKIIAKTTVPPTCGTQALADINVWNCDLVIPEGSLSSYTSADQWKMFFFVFEGDKEIETPTPTPTPSEDKEVKVCESPNISFSQGKLEFSCLTPNSVCHYNYKINISGNGAGLEVEPQMELMVSVYATAKGYEDSEVITKSFSISQNSMGADINGDGVINIEDVTALVNQILGK